MKRTKKALALLLSAILAVASFSVGVPYLKIEAEAANVTIGGITQQRIISNYETLYEEYARRFFGGDGKSEATDIVIPGLGQSDDFTHRV